MRKHLLLLFAALLPLLANAHDFEVEGIYYNIIPDTDFTVEVTHEGTYYSHSGEYKGVTTLDIPSTVVYNGVTYKVTGIGENAFYCCSTLTSITIPEGIISFGDSSFSGCSSLNAITIPNSVKTIGRGAFHGCSNLTAITIPEGITSLANETFRYCSNLSAVTISNSVTDIGKYVFSDCKNLVSLTIPESVATIGDGAFYGVEEIFFKSTVPPTLASKIAYAPTLILVPFEAYSAYYEAESWSDMVSLLAIDDENVRIREVTLEALDDASSLSAAIGDDNLKFVTNLTINGSINSYDFGVLRDKMPLLRHLYLSKATNQIQCL